MSIREYFNRLNRIFDSCAHLNTYDLTFDERTNEIGYVKGALYFPKGIELHFREYVDVARNEKYKYAYHVMRDTELVFRYDNADDVQARELESYPHHKHLADGSVTEAEEQSLQDVLAEIEALLFEG